MTGNQDISFRELNSPRFGMIAVKLGYITPEQLRKGLIIQINEDIAERAHRLLGEILCEEGWLTGEQCEEVAEKTRQCYGRPNNCRCI